jgi:hypothetical protein
MDRHGKFAQGEAGQEPGGFVKAVATSAEQVLQEVADELRPLIGVLSEGWKDAMTVAWNIVTRKLDAVRAAPKAGPPAEPLTDDEVGLVIDRWNAAPWTADVPGATGVHKLVRMAAAAQRRKCRGEKP